MVRCSVIGCRREYSQKLPEISVHRLPTCKERKQQWLDILGVENIITSTKYISICSLHFEEKWINRTLNVTRLLDDAVPSSNLLVEQAATSTKQRPPVGSVTSSDAGAQERSTRGTPPYVHHHAAEGSRCSQCDVVIQGPRTVCVQCPMCLCLACSATLPHDHHYMLRVPARRDQEEVFFVLNKLWDLIATRPKAEGSGHVETLHDTQPAMEAGAQLVECKQEAPDEEEADTQAEPELLFDYTTTPALDPISFDIKQEGEDDTEDIPIKFIASPFGAVSKRQSVDGPSQAKVLMIEIQPLDRTKANSNIPDTADVKHELMLKLKQKIGIEDRLGSRDGTTGDSSWTHKAGGSTTEKTGIHLGIQEPRELIQSEVNPSIVKIENSTDDMESMSVWCVGGSAVSGRSRGDGGIDHERELDAAVGSIGGEMLPETEPVLFKLGDLMDESFP